MNELDDLESQLDRLMTGDSFTDLIELESWFSDLEIKGISNYKQFDDLTYVRIPLIQKEQYDLLLCCWLPGQLSPFHGHPEQGCLVKMLEGSLQEELKRTDGSIRIRVNNKSRIAYINDRIGIHQVKNIFAQPAVSLHLYAPGGYTPDHK
jgi:cysteine dioxygenase